MVGRGRGSGGNHVKSFRILDNGLYICGGLKYPSLLRDNSFFQMRLFILKNWNLQKLLNMCPPFISSFVNILIHLLCVWAHTCVSGNRVYEVAHILLSRHVVYMARRDSADLKLRGCPGLLRRVQFNHKCLCNWEERGKERMRNIQPALTGF